jgi:hypothetical protein
VKLRLSLMTRGGLLIDAKLGLWNAAEVLVKNRTWDCTMQILA